MDLNHLSNHLLFTIEQISLLSGVRKSTLRYWEKSFHLCLNPSRTHSNRREYSLEDLERIKTIKRLLEEEHLTSHGVRLRLLELFPPSRKPTGGAGPNPAKWEVVLLINRVGEPGGPAAGPIPRPSGPGRRPPAKPGGFPCRDRPELPAPPWTNIPAGGRTSPP